LGFGLSFRAGQDKVWARLRERERGSGQRTQNWAEIFAETRGPRQHQAAGLLRCNHDANLFGDQLRGCARQSVVLPTNPQPYARQPLHDSLAAVGHAAVWQSCACALTNPMGPTLTTRSSGTALQQEPCPLRSSLEACTAAHIFFSRLCLHMFFIKKKKKISYKGTSVRRWKSALRKKEVSYTFFATAAHVCGQDLCLNWRVE